MKIYRIVDDGDVILVTADRIKALERLALLVKKYEDDVLFYWMDENEI